MKQTIVNCETGEVVEIEMTPEEIQKKEERGIRNAFQLLRQQRDRLLAESDWTVLADTPTSTSAWKVYRQELRDLPANTTDPFNPVWPTPPA